MRSILFATALTAIAPLAHAGNFLAINGETVTPAPKANQFDVVSRVGAGSGPRQIWCAAGEYAYNVLKAPGKTRLYLVEGTQRRPEYGNRRVTRFTIAPDAALAGGPRPGDDGNYSVSLKRAGFNLSVNHAEGFCPRRFEMFDDW